MSQSSPLNGKQRFIFIVQSKSFVDPSVPVLDEILRRYLGNHPCGPRRVSDRHLDQSSLPTMKSSILISRVSRFLSRMIIRNNQRLCRLAKLILNSIVLDLRVTW